jgi:spore maturation protein CgeB
MKIGFKFHPDKVGYKLGSLKPGQNRGFCGDEMTALSLRKELLRLPEVEYCELFNSAPPFKLDIIVYFHEDLPARSCSKKSVVYLQRGFNNGSDKALPLYQNRSYDGYMFISKKLLDLHKSMGYDGAFIPTAADTEYMRPLPPKDAYRFDVAYVGNDIKGSHRTMKYVYPATDFNFGLFGNWRSYSAFKDCLSPRGFFLRYFKIKYRRQFKKISQGQVLYEDLPVLYSSAKIVLNCTHQDNVNWDVITGRTYDVLACNGFLVSDIVPSAAEKFGDCAVFTTGDGDLTEKIKHYLKHEDQRLAIASKGREKILQHHSFKHRAIDMLNYFKGLL